MISFLIYNHTYLRTFRICVMIFFPAYCIYGDMKFLVTRDTKYLITILLPRNCTGSRGCGSHWFRKYDI